VEDSKREQGFKVVDRRLFTPEGELRQEVVEEERREQEAAAKKAAAQPAGKKEASAAASKPAASSTTGPEGALPFPSPTNLPSSGEKDVAEADSIPSSRGFQMLVDLLTRNAAAMLGGVADPRTGQAFLDLEGARELIDMLDALREKTRGNLSKEDDSLLIEVIGSLKLTFMEISKAAAEQMAKKAKGK
jgi:hypothetical protein